MEQKVQGFPSRHKKWFTSKHEGGKTITTAQLLVQEMINTHNYLFISWSNFIISEKSREQKETKDIKSLGDARITTRLDTS